MPGEPPRESALVTEEPGGFQRPGSRPGQNGLTQRGPDEQWATLGYLGAVFFWLLPPLVVYLARRKTSAFIRAHAAQSFNLILTGTLFALSVAIVGALLSLDSPQVSLVLMVPLLCALWIVVLVYLLRAAIAASRGEFYEIPAWICVPMLT